MLLDVKTLVSSDEEAIAFDYEMDWSGLDWNQAQPFVTPVRVTGQVEVRAEAPVLHADVAFGFLLPCDRCASPTRREFRHSFDHKLALSLQGEETEEYLVVEDGILDLDELIRADVLLELPSKYLCSPDCKGLCAGCGVNRNHERCTCDPHPVDPRLEVLKQLMEE